MLSIYVSILNTKGEIIKSNIDFYQCVEKLLKFRLISTQNQNGVLQYQLPFVINQTSLDIFFEAAQNRKSSDELKELITILNAFDLYNLSIEFIYKDFEDQIQSFIENYQFQKGDVKSITNFRTLDQSFFDQFVSLQINSILENAYTELDEVPGLRLYQIFSKSNFTNMSILCKYLIHRYQSHLKLNINREIEMDILLFLFVDASNLPEDIIEELIPISDVPHFQIPKLTSRIYQLFNN